MSSSLIAIAILFLVLCTDFTDEAKLNSKNNANNNNQNNNRKKPIPPFNIPLFNCFNHSIANYSFIQTDIAGCLTNEVHAVYMDLYFRMNNTEYLQGIVQV
jgi:hypothetical protein